MNLKLCPLVSSCRFAFGCGLVFYRNYLTVAISFREYKTFFSLNILNSYSISEDSFVKQLKLSRKTSFWRENLNLFLERSPKAQQLAHWQRKESGSSRHIFSQILIFISILFCFITVPAESFSHAVTLSIPVFTQSLCSLDFYVIAKMFNCTCHRPQLF